MNMKEQAADIFNAALIAADPYEAVKRHRASLKALCRQGAFKAVNIVAFGKAAFAMTRAIVDQFDAIIEKGIVITKYGHSQREVLPARIEAYEAGHPVPDENGMAATNRAVELLSAADRNTLVVCLISGGGSSLLVAPSEPLSLTEKQTVTRLLLQSGADIAELNTVRKHLSCVKGGRLAEIAYPAQVVSLILSDVINDRIDVIASGPTAPDESTYRDALRVLDRYGLTRKVPQNVHEILMAGSEGRRPETPKMGNPLFSLVRNIIVGSNGMAVSAAKDRAVELGLDTTVVTSELQGEARESGRWLARMALESRSRLSDSAGGAICLVSGGETTVTVRGNGLGGRNMELAVSFAMEVEGIEGITLLSAGTDGTDGPTDAAGGIVDGETIRKARTCGFAPELYLANNDSYHILERAGDLFITGPTGTNVMDLQIVLINNAS
ncbi:MAG: putative hydroxypyruvate reductase [Syntrophorhabdus sp. PtaB.Bin006]|nr:MAG: putative hydroxypyruvate reductase [Syntrophorhabdus sp. PtaB.Bin006]